MKDEWQSVSMGVTALLCIAFGVAVAFGGIGLIVLGVALTIINEVLDLIGRRSK